MSRWHRSHGLHNKRLAPRSAGKITGETSEIILLTQDITAVIRCKLPRQINLWLAFTACCFCCLWPATGCCKHSSIPLCREKCVNTWMSGVCFCLSSLYIVLCLIPHTHTHTKTHCNNIYSTNTKNNLCKHDNKCMHTPKTCIRVKCLDRG